MKRVSVVAIIFLFVCSAFLQTNAQSQDPVQVIRQQYASINRNAAKYKKVKKELMGFSAEGGELIAYLSGPSIVKISATFYGEMGRATDEFYYSNDKLIFRLSQTVVLPCAALRQDSSDDRKSLLLQRRQTDQMD